MTDLEQVLHELFQMVSNCENRLDTIDKNMPAIYDRLDEGELCRAVDPTIQGQLDSMRDDLQLFEDSLAAMAFNEKDLSQKIDVTKIKTVTTTCAS